MNNKNVSLEEAVRNVNATNYFIWFTSGDVVENSFVKNGYTSRIGVSRLTKKATYSVTMAIHGGEDKLAIKNLGNFSNLDELRKRFPELFEVTGNLYVH